MRHVSITGLTLTFSIAGCADQTSNEETSIESGQEASSQVTATGVGEESSPEETSTESGQEASSSRGTTTAAGEESSAEETFAADPEVMAEVMCGALHACGCSTSWPTYEACVAEHAARSDDFAAAAAIGASVDEGCYEQFMSVYGATTPNCELTLSAGELVGAVFCDAFVGPLGEGDPCVEVEVAIFGGPADACAPGLVCAGGFCSAPPEAGEACLTPRLSAECADGHVCDGGICVPEPNFGDTCLGNLRCGENKLCTGGVCGSRHVIGQKCWKDSQCESSKCEYEVCVETPAVCVAGDGSVGMADGRFCDCFALDPPSETSSLPTVVNRCNVEPLCAFEQTALSYEDDGAEPSAAELEGLQCALEALAAGERGKIRYEAHFGLIGYYREIFITGNGDAYFSDVPHSDSDVVVTLVGVKLHPPEVFTACLQGSPQEQLDCLADLGEERVNCME